MIKAAEEIIAGSNERFRVVDVVPFAEEDESRFVGLLRVEEVAGGAAASGGPAVGVSRWTRSCRMTRSPPRWV